MDETEDDPLAIQEIGNDILYDMPTMFKDAGETEQFYYLLTSCEFLQIKIEIRGIESLLDDYELAKDFLDDAEHFTLQRIANALRAGAVCLKQAPDELWNQVKGRANVELQAEGPRPLPRLDLRSASLPSADPALLQILQGHTGAVTACALSADGKWALSSSVDGTLRLWDTISGEAVYTLQGHTSGVTACALSANGKIILSGGQDRTLRLWNTVSSVTVRILQEHTGSVTACALSENGLVALSGDEKGTLRLWNTVSGEELHTWSFPSTKVIRCMLSADGKLGISYSLDLTLPLRKTRTLRLWDNTSGKMLRSWNFPLVWEVADCALSANGQRVLIVSNLLGFRAKLEVWNTASRWRIRKLKGFKGAVGSCALSADGDFALTGSRTAFLGPLMESQSAKSALIAIPSTFRAFDNFEGSTLRLWDIKSGKTRHILQGHRDSVAFCSLSADGKLALSCSTSLVEQEDDRSLADPSEHRALRLWNIASKEATDTLEHNTAPVAGCVLSANGQRAFTFAQGDGRLRVWDTVSGQTLHILKHKQAVASCALSADGKLALSVCYDSRLRLWDTENGKMLRSWAHHIIGMKDCALSADGRWALSLRLDGLLHLWDTTNGQTLTSFLPEEKPAEGYRKWTLNFAGRGFALSADGNRALFVSKDGALQIWNRGDIQALSMLENSLNKVDNWALSADGQRVLAASEDGTLRIWNVESGRILHTLTGHTGIVPMCSLSANGRLALSVSVDRTLRLWNTDNGQEITRWTHEIQLWRCSLSADGRVAVAGDIDGGVHFLEVVEVAKAEDMAAAKLPVSWLAEKSQRKPSLLRRLFGKKEAKEKEGKVDTQKSVERENPLEKDSTYKCSFCGKSQNQVQQLIVGPQNVFICDECIDLCREIINEGDEKRRFVNLKTDEEGKKVDEDNAAEEESGKQDRDYLDKLSERAKKVLSLAQEEARGFQHNYIGTEHLLLGLIREDEGIAAEVLRNLGVKLSKIRSAIEYILGRGDRIVSGKIGLTPRSQKVIELAFNEARLLNHDHIAPEHLLLGLIREGEGIAAGVLESLGVNLEEVRTQTIRALNQGEAKATIIEVTVESVRIKEETQQRVVILQAKEQRERYLLVWIDHLAAYAIATELKGIPPHPTASLPHDLLKNVIDALGAKLASVEIWDLQDDIFRGRLVLDAAGQRLEINARSSDAIALALRAEAPIFVAEQVMERAGVLGEGDEPFSPNTQA